MRLSYPNLTRPKKSAKVVARLTRLATIKSKAAVARICGYHKDRHDFEINHARTVVCIGPPNSATQNTLGARDSGNSILTLATEVGVPDGDAQFALAHARLTGDRPEFVGGAD